MTDSQIPRATYRLQLESRFGFDDAARVAPYLAELGISHLYLSPILTARRDSTHGYDAVRFDEVSPDLGGRAGLERLSETLAAHGMRLLVDFVPNHMGVGGDRNALWLDLLERGRDSEAARWFDVDWSRHDGRVLVPFLGEPYGRALGSGALTIRLDAEDGGLAVWAHEAHKLPLAPETYRDALPPEFAEGLDGDPAAAKAALSARLADEPVREAIERHLDALNGEAREERGGSRLAALIAAQHWRPAHFRLAADEINYRRFFNISDLAAIRIEDDAVFADAHRLLFDLIEAGIVHGVRLDHVDGLLDPASYCRRLRAASPRPIYLVVEKILSADEMLPQDWGVDGTTGYDFANLALGLMIDPAGETPLTEAYRRFTGESRGFAEIARESKQAIMRDEMASELATITARLAALAAAEADTVDLAPAALRRAVAAILTEFSVYRSYVAAEGPVTEVDRRVIGQAVRRARRRHPMIDPAAFDFVAAVMTLTLPAGTHPPEAVRDAAMRIQQYSGPVMAKGCEDTAFYRYNRLLALNEVGGDPDRFGLRVDAFHRAVARRAAVHPHAVLATSTHDTKRGEDARARLAALSERGDEWAAVVEGWSATLHERAAAAPQAAQISRNDEYAFYQILVGAWPADPSAILADPGAIDALRERIETTMIKVVREAKQESFWVAPNEAYEAAVRTFIGLALGDDGFLGAVGLFVERLAPAGLRNSLIQTVLKLTLPGVPDIYQGAERLDLGMVDPDNRRPVDFERRAASLASNDEEGETPDGVKQGLVAALLALRRRSPALFENGTYEPVFAEGTNAARICAFLRRHAGEGLLVACRLGPEEENGPLRLALPEDVPAEGLRDARAGDAPARLDQALSEAPVAVLTWSDADLSDRS
ncbi:malto-oligosyltrehalose synthase [Prosthecomicrobium pneumaticum]|uniref:(1->4)-alpha-D-glucan 1-alpha-D-glucosylmutase n=1 Tax=Prosthecomicrobium pneumaticum TaxID=81895 RepID=A0A7W9CUY8_9HYPH|nr:malto-oligosyltrehalose synthase [Prosthecomicrobium pneumaticum]MBB5752360.1 (1->4)-alpha-D-glucan 1-alpha-D-glucosylmutase [Prosthecomicrobium pneumaticum]